MGTNITDEVHILSKEEFCEALALIAAEQDELDKELLYRRLEVLGPRRPDIQRIKPGEEDVLEQDIKYICLNERHRKLCQWKQFIAYVGILPEDWDLW